MKTYGSLARRTVWSLTFAFALSIIPGSAYAQESPEGPQQSESAAAQPAPAIQEQPAAEGVTTPADAVSPDSAAASDETTPSEDAATESVTATPPATEAKPDGAAANQVMAELSEYTISMPSSLPAGATTITVGNNGAETHGLAIRGENDEYKLPVELQPGDLESFTIELLPGEYEVVDPVGENESKGMKMTLTVTGTTEEETAAPEGQ